ncbi:KxYKxGKxW signal peptide domain-containing protein, partial [Periweissella fabaria]
MSKKNNYYKLMHETKYEHFKMYKAGKQWFVAGMSLFGGILGASAVGTQVAHADVTNGNNDTAKEVDQGTVLATQKTATIPAASTSTSTIDSTSQSTSTSKSLSESTSVSQSESTTQASTSKSQLTTKDDASTASSSTSSVSKTPASTSTTSESKNDSTASTSDASTSTASQSKSDSKASTSDSSTSTTSESKSDSTTSTSDASTSTASDSTTASTSQSLSASDASTSASNGLPTSTTVTSLTADKDATADAQKALAAVLPSDANLVVDSTTHELSIVLVNDQTPSTAILNAAQAYAEANGLVVNFNHRDATTADDTTPKNFGDYKSSVLSYVTKNNLYTQAQINSDEFQSALAGSYQSFLTQPKQLNVAAANGMPQPFKTPSAAPLWFIIFYQGGFTSGPKVVNAVVNQPTKLSATNVMTGVDAVLFTGQNFYTWYQYDNATSQWVARFTDNNKLFGSTVNFTASQAGTYYFQVQSTVNIVFGSIPSTTYYSYIITVHVFDKPQNATTISTSVDNNYLYYNGQNAQATANVGNGTGTITWASSNTGLATIDSQTGFITANNNGKSGVVTFTATITNPDGTTLSSSVQVQVGGGLNDQTVLAGNPATFNLQGKAGQAQPADSTTTNTYQWYKAGAISILDTKLDGQTGPTLVLPNTTSKDNGSQYYAIITTTSIDSKGQSHTSSFTTNKATLNVISNTPSNSTSISNSTSQSTSISNSIPASTSKVVSTSDSMSMSDSMSQSDSILQPSRSASASDSAVKSTSMSTSVSDSTVKSNSTSKSTADSLSTSTSDSAVKSTSMSTSESDSASTVKSNSTSKSTADSLSTSTSDSAVKSTSLSTSESDSASTVKSNSTSKSTADSLSTSTSDSAVKST